MSRLRSAHSSLQESADAVLQASASDLQLLSQEKAALTAAYALALERHDINIIRMEAQHQRQLELTAEESIAVSKQVEQLSVKLEHTLEQLQREQLQKAAAFAKLDAVQEQLWGYEDKLQEVLQYLKDAAPEEFKELQQLQQLSQREGPQGREGQGSSAQAELGAEGEPALGRGIWVAQHTAVDVGKTKRYNRAFVARLLAAAGKHGDSVTGLTAKVHSYLAAVLDMSEADTAAAFPLPQKSQMKVYFRALGAAGQASSGKDIATARQFSIEQDGTKIARHNREATLITATPGAGSHMQRLAAEAKAKAEVEAEAAAAKRKQAAAAVVAGDGVGVAEAGVQQRDKPGAAEKAAGAVVQEQSSSVPIRYFGAISTTAGSTGEDIAQCGVDVVKRQGILLYKLISMSSDSTASMDVAVAALQRHNLPRFRIERKFDTCDCNVTSF